MNGIIKNKKYSPANLLKKGDVVGVIINNEGGEYSYIFMWDGKNIISDFGQTRKKVVVLKSMEKYFNGKYRIKVRRFGDNKLRKSVLKFFKKRLGYESYTQIIMNTIAIIYKKLFNIKTKIKQNIYIRDNNCSEIFMQAYIDATGKYFNNNVHPSLSTPKNIMTNTDKLFTVYENNYT